MKKLGKKLNPAEIARSYLKTVWQKKSHLTDEDDKYVRDFCCCLGRYGGVYNIPDIPYAIKRVEKTYDDFNYKAILPDGGESYRYKRYYGLFANLFLCGYYYNKKL